ncbi:MAG TPA: ATP-grasp domain-containing protein [Kiritimatiellia bacterium]|mgnify:CR=1 FL=1|nr:ATP-grasp domain-containing protein [Kiritimatiellia bacterium]
MKTLAIIGGSYLQRPLVAKAKAMGLRTLCFSIPEGAVCREVADDFFPISITEKDAILSVCRDCGIDGIVSIASDVAVPTVAYVAEKLGLVGNSMESAFKTTNKYAMRKALVEGGVRCPRFSLVTSTAEANRLWSGFEGPVIIKPCDRSGSLGVTKVDDPGELPEAVSRALTASFCGQAIMEAFIGEAKEISIEGISWGSSYYPLAITDKVTSGPPNYVELGHHQPSALPCAIIEEALDQVRLGLRALSIEVGATHPELMVTPEGEVFVTEIGARMGGDFIGSDLVELSTGYDFLRGVILVALGDFERPVLSEGKRSGVWFHSPQTPWVGEVIRALPPELVRWELNEQEAKPLTRSADRSGYFIYQSDRDADITFGSGALTVS